MNWGLQSLQRGLLETTRTVPLRNQIKLRIKKNSDQEKGSLVNGSWKKSESQGQPASWSAKNVNVYLQCFFARSL